MPTEPKLRFQLDQLWHKLWTGGFDRAAVEQAALEGPSTGCSRRGAGGLFKDSAVCGEVFLRLLGSLSTRAFDHGSRALTIAALRSSCCRSSVTRQSPN